MIMQLETLLSMSFVMQLYGQNSQAMILLTTVQVPAPVWILASSYSMLDLVTGTVQGLENVGTFMCSQFISCADLRKVALIIALLEKTAERSHCFHQDIVHNTVASFLQGLTLPGSPPSKFAFVTLLWFIHCQVSFLSLNWCVQ